MEHTFGSTLFSRVQRSTGRPKGAYPNFGLGIDLYTLVSKASGALVSRMMSEMMALRFYMMLQFTEALRRRMQEDAEEALDNETDHTGKHPAITFEKQRTTEKGKSNRTEGKTFGGVKNGGSR